MAQARADGIAVRAVLLPLASGEGAGDARLPRSAARIVLAMIGAPMPLSFILPVAHHCCCGRDTVVT